VIDRLILVRHGESEANVVDSLHTGVPGPPLTALGREQAEQLVDTLAGEDVRSVWASTMTRAQQTAAPLAAALGLTVEVREGLREVDVGDLHDRRDAEAHDVLSDVLAGWMLRGDLSLRCPGGECGTDLTTRFGAVLKEIVDSGDAGAAVVVAHGAALRTTLLGLCGLDPAFVLAHHLPNTGYVVVDLEGDNYACRTWAGLVPNSGASGVTCSDELG
jgi:broad specificity phosphatase PhoE